MVGATVPDLRGEFVRGWAHDRTGIADSGRFLGSIQTDDFKSHDHPRSPYGFNEIAYWTIGTNLGGFASHNSGEQYFAATTGLRGGTETRPHNIALLPCIKY